MQQPRPFWFLLDFYGWVVLIMSIITAFLIQQWWVVLIGFIGYLLVLIVDLVGGRALGRTGAMRLARTEQENRELKAEQARLLGAIQERDQKLADQNESKTKDIQ
jgi:ABC-type multidrug transport system fused ATPase/permease subunit